MMSSRGHDISTISGVFGIQPDTVGKWFDRWENEGSAGIMNLPKSGRPRIFSATEEKKIADASLGCTSVKHLFGSDGDVCGTGKRCGTRTLTNVLKRLGRKWKRMRKSLKRNRDEVLFRFFMEEMNVLREMHREGQINLWYMDATGFGLSPNVPYGWQPKGQRVLLPAERGSGKTLLGAVSADGDRFTGHLWDGAANAQTVAKLLTKFDYPTIS